MSYAQVSPESLGSLKDLMANYREAARHSVSNPVSHFCDNVEAMLTEVTKAMDSYLADALQPIITALKYCDSVKFLS